MWPCDQLIMRALLDDPARLEHQNAIDLPHRREAVRDHDRGAALHELDQAGLDRPLRDRIQGRGGLVQDQHRPVGQDRARNRNPLPLAARQLDAALADQGLVAVRQVGNEAMGMGEARGAHDLGVARLRPRISDVLGQRAVEQHRLLRHQRNRPAQARLRHAGDVLAVDRDATAVEVVKPLQQLDQRALAAARAADQRHFLAGPDRDREIVEHRLVLARVDKAHALEPDRSGGNAQRSSTRPIDHVRRRAGVRDHVLEIVGRPLQRMDLGADVAQIAIDHEEAGDHERDVAGRRPTQPPEPERASDQHDIERQHGRALHDRGVDRGRPGAHHALPPALEQQGQPLVLAPLGACRLDHADAGDRVGERAAEPAVRLDCKPPARRHVGRCHVGADRRVGGSAHDQQNAHERPVHRSQHRDAEHHRGRRHQADVQGVAEVVERPDAARDLAHRSAGQRVGVPLRAVALHARKRVGADLPHDVDREATPEIVARFVEHLERQAERQDHDQGVYRRARVTRAERVDQPADPERNVDLGQRGAGEHQPEQEDAAAVTAPVAPGERENRDEAGHVGLPDVLTARSIGGGRGDAR